MTVGELRELLTQYPDSMGIGIIKHRYDQIDYPVGVKATDAVRIEYHRWTFANSEASASERVVVIY